MGEWIYIINSSGGEPTYPREAFETFESMIFLPGLRWDEFGFPEPRFAQMEIWTWTNFLEEKNKKECLPGQNIATSAEVTPNGGLVKESFQNSLNSGLGIILICPDFLCFQNI